MSDRTEPSRLIHQNRNLARAQKGIVIVVAAVGVALGGLAFIGRATSRPPSISQGLSVSQSRLAQDSAGRWVWSGTVSNQSDRPVTSPWVRVTLFEPAGASVDSAAATPPKPTISAHGSVSYSSSFDTRGTDLRVRTRLEAPNTRPLGL